MPVVNLLCLVGLSLLSLHPSVSGGSVPPLSILMSLVSLSILLLWWVSPSYVHPSSLVGLSLLYPSFYLCLKLGHLE